MSKKILTTPIKDEDLADIKVGDVIYLNGYLITARDCAHTRLVKLGRQLPVDLKGKAIFHAGPIMVPRKDEPGRFDVVSIGPTTSMRMEKFQKQFLEQTGVKLIIGKGGMGPNTTAGCQETKALHCVFPGGCAVVAACCVEEVEDVQWQELGMPEAMWVMRVKEFGPLVVSIDTHGNNLFEINKKHFAEVKDEVLETIYPNVSFTG
ncbi:MAG: L(+)-tartrate dehydratase subunit beta [Candidatus Aphodousia sp.]|nr:L(+)-tartrate dehydratase subunit beta [Sutterella sp.]MDY2900309.1 L(+)-tartrate dehydratase subunit beta [Candidatus Aphodousia sp.]